MVFQHSWVELSRSNLLSNLQTTRKKLSKKIKLFAVVKANAYGHGLKEVINISNKHVDAFCFAGSEEALQARAFTKKRIIVLSYFATLQKKHLIKLSKKEIEVPIFDISTLRAMQRLKKEIKIHVKIDTGATRIGFLKSEIGFVAKMIRDEAHLKLTGVYSHFAEAEKPKSRFTKNQKDLFNSLSAKLIKESGVKRIVERHIACSAALATNTQTHFDAVRLGIHLYGLSGLPPLSTPALKPVLSWKTHVIQIKKVTRGVTIGYNRTYKVKKNKSIAIIPVGYADGLPRLLSNKGYVLIHGKKAFILGTVCMNLTMIDVTSIPGVKRGDQVTIISNEKG